MNDRVEVLESDRNMEDLIKDFNNTQGKKKKLDQVKEAPLGDKPVENEEDAWGNFSDLNNTKDMGAIESARSGFSEFDGRKDGDILNAIK